MADLAEIGSKEPFSEDPSLRRALRRAVESALPEMNIVADGFLAEVSPIDLLAVGAEGELVAIRVASPGRDPETLTHLLADLSWLRPRREDFLKLAPGLGIDPSIEPRALLVAPAFSRETRAAVDNFPAHTIQLWQSLPGWENRQPTLRIEPVGWGAAAKRFVPAASASTPPSAPARPGPESSPPSARRPESSDRSLPLTAPPSPSAFRTGLRESDLIPGPAPERGVGTDLEAEFQGSPRA